MITQLLPQKPSTIYHKYTIEFLVSLALDRVIFVSRQKKVIREQSMITGTAYEIRQFGCTVLG
jgi:hypothetical protein